MIRVILNFVVIKKKKKNMCLLDLNRFNFVVIKIYKIFLLLVNFKGILSKLKEILCEIMNIVNNC